MSKRVFDANIMTYDAVVASRNLDAIRVSLLDVCDLFDKETPLGRYLLHVYISLDFLMRAQHDADCMSYHIEDMKEAERDLASMLGEDEK